MKKIKIIALLSIIFILVATVSVFAADAPAVEVTLRPSSTTAKVGDTVTVEVFVKTDAEIAGLLAVLEYDKTKLELTNVGNITDGTVYDDYSHTDSETGMFTLEIGEKVHDGETPKEATVAKLNFKVLEAVSADEELSIKLSAIEVANNSSDDWTPVTDNVETVLKVIKETTPGNEQQQTQQESQQQTQQTQQQAQKTDDTIANKTINKAGLSNYAFIIVLGAIVAVVLYAKCKKYKDIK